MVFYEYTIIESSPANPEAVEKNASDDEALPTFLKTGLW